MAGEFQCSRANAKKDPAAASGTAAGSAKPMGGNAPKIKETPDD